MIIEKISDRLYIAKYKAVCGIGVSHFEALKSLLDCICYK